MNNDLLDQAAALLRNSKRPVAFTGAGMSAESGISTFRNSEASLWSRWEPEHLATAHGFREDKALVWGWYVWRMATVLKAQPHAGHQTLAAMEQRWPKFAVVTQNVDNLHERAGSTRIAHLHGNIFTHRCFACGRPAAFEVPLDAVDNPQLRLAPPKCEHCGGCLRPGVVWFGENLPQAEWKQASQWIRECDLLLVVGTSGVVEPAASLATSAKARGTKIILIDPNDIERLYFPDVHLQGGAATLLPQLLKQV